MSAPLAIDWSTTQMTAPVKKKAAVHSLFAEFEESCDDPYWKDRMATAAKGKFPRGFSYSSGVLTYKEGTKSFSIDVPPGPYEGCSAVIEFMQVHGGLYSQRDNERVAERERTSETRPVTWTRLTKEMKAALIFDHVQELGELLSLTPCESEQLKAVVEDGLFTKTISRERLTLSGRNITAIDNLRWDPEQRSFSLESDRKRAPKKYQKKEREASRLEEGWGRYLSGFLSRDEGKNKPRNKMGVSIYLEGQSAEYLVDFEDESEILLLN